MSKKAIFALFLAITLLPVVVLAETLALNPNHPDRYVVKEGDTLWDISGRFLQEPWRWQEIWQANPQIKNPDLIYPGDELSLSFEAGKPVLRVRRRVGGRPTVKLSPKVRPVVLDTAVPTIPVDVIQPFLSRPKVVAEDELDKAPYIVSLGKEHLLGGAGTKIYVRGIEGSDATDYTVYRKGEAYRDPDTNEILGYEATYIGDAVMQRAGDPAILVLSKTAREALAGDRLVAVGDEDFQRNFVPRAPDESVTGKIISLIGGVNQIGQYQVVVLNRGVQHGLAPGHVLAVYQTGIQVKDRFAKSPEVRESLFKDEDVKIETDPEKQGGFPGFFQAMDDVVNAISDALRSEDDSYKTTTLPEERAGIVMIFRPFEKVSYALVMDATRAMHLLDTVKSP